MRPPYFILRIIESFFHRLKLIEAYGTGIQKIMDSYKDSTNKPQIQSSDNAFKIVLPNRNNILRQSILNDNEKVILELVERNGAIVRKDINEALSLSQTMAGRLLSNY